MGHRGLLIEPNGTMCRKLSQVPRRPSPRSRRRRHGRPRGRLLRHEQLRLEHLLEGGGRAPDPGPRRKGHPQGGHQGAPARPEPGHGAAPAGARPAFLSVDVQGLELAILKSIDYDQFRPKVICAETLVTGTREMTHDIAAFMEKRGYVVRGMLLRQHDLRRLQTHLIELVDLDRPVGEPRDHFQLASQSIHNPCRLRSACPSVFPVSTDWAA